MGFEAYTVVLVPCADSPLSKEQAGDAVLHLAREIRQEWPDICRDTEEEKSLVYLSEKKDTFLVYQTKQGLFQLLLSQTQEQISISLRFAFCNPRSIYEPFISMIAGLMERYQMCGYTMNADQSRELTSADSLAALTPSMDYNRTLWQADARTTEEAVLRPGDAISRFILI